MSDGVYFNSQPESPLEIDPAGRLAVHSVFHSVQSEGPQAGNVSVFVRLAGCNLDCPLCEVDYTSRNSIVDPLQLLNQIQGCTSHPCKSVVFTGGEPFRQNIVPAVRLLINSGYHVLVETNGTHFTKSLPVPHVSIVCSPKTETICKDMESWNCSYKYIIDHKNRDSSDGLPTSVLGNDCKRVARPSPNFAGDTYVAPMRTGNPTEDNQNVIACVDSVYRFNYLLCMKSHAELI